jgi:hypothetical protein
MVFCFMYVLLKNKYIDLLKMIDLKVLTVNISSWSQIVC